MSKKQEQNAKYAEHEDAPETTGDLPIVDPPKPPGIGKPPGGVDIDEDRPLTPGQIAELEERKTPWMERFKAAVDDVAARHAQGTAPAPAVVAELRALYDEMAGADGTPPEPAPAEEVQHT